MREWTETEDRYLNRRYSSESTAAIAAFLGRSAWSIYKRVRVLRLKKSAEFKSRYTQARLRPGFDPLKYKYTA